MPEYALLEAGREPITHSDLSLHTAAAARALTLSGVEPGDAVALLLPDGPEFLAAYLAVAQTAACAPLNPALTRADYEYALADIRPVALIVESGAASPAIAVARDLDIAVFELHAGGGPAGTFIVRPRTEVKGGARKRRFGPGLLLHTSATTGHPKLVALSRQVVSAMGDVTTRALRLTSSDRFLSLMPLFHAQGLLASLAQLRARGGVIAMRGFDANAFTTAVHELDPTWYTAGPALQRAIVALGPGRRFRFARSIGAALPLSLLEQVEATLEAPVIEGYGLTEGGTVTTNPLPPERRKPGSAGRPAGPEIRLVNGEIQLRGPSVITGYANEADNRDAFDDGWLRTGDLGHFDEDGYLYITGRLREIIHRGGEKIRPAEIDEVLAAHAAVAEAAAFAVPHPTLGQDVAAAVVLRRGAAATEAELRAFAAGMLAAFKVPRRIHIVDAIPKSATGKPRRGALADRFEHAPATAAPSGEVEERLAEIWKALLRVPAVAPDDDFFALGGDSLAATLMLTEAQTAFSLSASLLDRVEFFDRPTVRALAAIIAQMESDPSLRREPAAVIALVPSGSLPPIFAMPWAGDDPYYFREVARQLGPGHPFYAVRNPQPAERLKTVEELAAQARQNLEAVCPSGPFLLAGHCFGGIIAFETARQLRGAGRAPLALLLFDAPTPGYPKVGRAGRRYWRYLLTRPTGLDRAAVLAHMRTLGRLMKRNAGAAFGRSAPAMAGRAAGIDEANHQSARLYKPAPLGVPVLQFLAADEPITARVLDDPRLGWADFAPRGFRVERVPGTHATMFVGTHAARLAEAIRSSITPILTEYRVIVE